MLITANKSGDGGETHRGDPPMEGKARDTDSGEEDCDAGTDERRA